MTAWVPDALHFIHVIEDLLRGGHPVRFRAPGWSMHPTIRNGEIITVVPLGRSPVQVGDVVLYRRGRAAIAHRVIDVYAPSGRPPGLVLRGDGANGCDRPIGLDQVLGRVLAVERRGRTVHLGLHTRPWPRTVHWVRRAAHRVRLQVAAILAATHKLRQALQR